MHDETLQGLVGLHMLLAGARRQPDRDRLLGAIDTALEVVTDEIQKLRYLIVDLRPDCPGGAHERGQARCGEVCPRSVTDLNGRVEVSVSDDGRGFSETSGEESFGLVGMKERAALAGGRLNVVTSGSGTTIEFAGPVVRAEPA